MFSSRGFKKGVKIMFYDLETTGLLHWKHEVWQFAAVIVRTTGEGAGYEIVERFSCLIKPEHPETMEKAAAEINNLTIETFEDPSFLPPKEAVDKIKRFLSKHVDRYDKNDKLIRAGHNVTGFDNDFFMSFVGKHDPELRKYFFSYFHKHSLDTYHLTSIYRMMTDALPAKFNLGALSEHLGVNLENAHDAVSDVEASIECAFKLLALFFGEVDKEE